MFKDVKNKKKYNIIFLLIILFTSLTLRYTTKLDVYYWEARISLYKWAGVDKSVLRYGENKLKEAKLLQKKSSKEMSTFASKKAEKDYFNIVKLIDFTTNCSQKGFIPRTYAVATEAMILKTEKTFPFNKIAEKKANLIIDKAIDEVNTTLSKLSYSQFKSLCVYEIAPQVDELSLKI